MRAGKLSADARTAQALDCLAVTRFGVCSVAEQGPAARLKAERPVGAAGLGESGESLKRVERAFGLVGPRRRRDELDERCPVGGTHFHLRVSGRLGCSQSLLIAAEAVAQQCLPRAASDYPVALATACVLGEASLDPLEGLGYTTLPGGEEQRAVPGERRAARVVDRLLL